MDDRFELPSDLVQEAIAYACGIQRKHLSQYLAKLKDDGLLIERKSHIQGMKQRMNGYYLTPAGGRQASDLRARIAGLQVPVIVNGLVKSMKVSEIDDATSVHITYCDIIREALESDRLEMSTLERVELRKIKALERKEQSTESYKRALETAWRDGRVTATERFLIDELRRILKITDEQHRMLEDEIVKKLAQDHMEFRRVYRQVLEVALSDGALDGPEVEIIENLRRSFRISTKEHEELLEEVRDAMMGPEAPGEMHSFTGD